MNDQNQPQETGSGKVRPFRRERLEPEIVAMSVEISDDHDPALIVNIDDPAAKGAIKRVLVWLFGLGGLIEWARRSANRPILLAVAGTATVVSVGTFAVTEVTRNGDERRPPVVAQRTVAVPPAVTVTAIHTPTAAPTSSQPPQEDHEEGGRLPTARPTSPVRPAADTPPPQAQATPPPTRKSRTPGPTLEGRSTQRPQPADDSEATQENSPSNAGAQTPDEPDPEPTAAADPPEQTSRPAPAPAPSPTAAEADCDGLVEVDLNPLLDLCLLD